MNRLDALAIAAAVVLVGGGAATGTVGQLDETKVVSRPTGTGPVPPGLVNGSYTTTQSVSGDGRYVVFASDSDGLSGEDDDRYTNVFVRDRQTNTTILVSRASGASGAPANGSSFSAVISRDGRHVAFYSQATNLDPAGTAPNQVYVRDLDTNVTKLGSRAHGPDGAVANGDSYSASISEDGHRVAFRSNGTNLDPANSTQGGDVWVRDLNTGGTFLVSRKEGPTGVPAPGETPSISDDGNVVAFVTAVDLVAGDTTPYDDVYTRDLAGNHTYLMSLTAGPTPDPRAFFPSINGNGTKVAFATQRSYDGADTNNTPDVYVSDGGTITLASRADGTTGAGGNGYTSGASMNKDGTQVAFASSSSNLVTGDVNGKEDVFVRNLSTGHTVLVSRADGAAGAEGDNDSYLDSINTDGTTVAFTSLATNFKAPAEADNISDAYTRDLGTNRTSAIARPTGTAPFKGETGPSFATGVSADGRYVVFASGSNNLSTEDDDRYTNAFVRDTLRDTTTLVDRQSGAAGSTANRDAFPTSISDDGTKVALSSAATNLAPGDTNGVTDVFVRDLAANTTTRVSVGSSGGELNMDSSQPVISGDGTKVVFVTSAAIDSVDTNGKPDVYLRDLSAGTTTLVSRANGASGAVGNDPSGGPDLATRGDKVAFFTYATNLTGGPPGAVVVRDLAAGTTTVASRADGPAGGPIFGYQPAISGDGKVVAFTSEDAGVPADTNNNFDVYARDVGANKTVLVSRAPAAAGPVGNGGSDSPTIDETGTHVGFRSFATNLDTAAQVGFGHAFVRDLATNTVQAVDRASGPSGAVGDKSSSQAVISANGQCAVFSSISNGLSPDLARSDFFFVYMRTLAGECPNDPPDTTIGSKPAARTKSRDAAFTFTSNDSTATFQCSLDGAAFAACGGGQTYSGLAEGAHTFAVRAVDPAGNLDTTPATAPWTIDVTAPKLALSVPRQKLRRALARGLRLKLRASEPATVLARVLYKGRRIANVRIKLGTTSRTVAIKLRPSKKARRVLRRARSAGFVLSLSAGDDLGNTRTIRRAVRLRR